MNIAKATVAASVIALAASAATAADIEVTLMGYHEETVYDYLAQRCSNFDHPDMPPRAWYDRSTSTVHFLANNFETRQATGSSLFSLTYSCDLLYQSERDADPAQHSYMDWLIAPYILPGGDVVGLVHSEYHGKVVGGCTGTSNQCWYNVMTQTVSTDGGNTFQQPGAEPAKIAMSLPEPFALDQSMWAGHRNPTNIFRGPDGAHYIFTYVSGGGAHNSGQQNGNCLFRSDNLADHTAWRGWDGTGFNVAMVDPYKVTPANPADHYCQPIGPGGSATSLGSVQYHAPSGLYLMIWAQHVWELRENGKWEPRGYVFSSTSSDLITWAPRRAIQQRSLWGSDCPADPSNWTTYGYIGLLPITPGPTDNFDVHESNWALLYATAFRRNSCTNNVARDLVRQWVSITVIP